MQTSLFHIANILTFSRVPALFLIMAFIYLPIWGASTVAFFLFLISAFSDWLDGYLARRLKIVSNLGKFMDALTDKILVVGLLVTILEKSILPNWGLMGVILIICREFLVTGLRLVAAGRYIVIGAEKTGKQKTVIQLLSIGALLFAYMIECDWVVLCGHSFMRIAYGVGYVMFIIAVILTVSSGYNYLKKYWTVLKE